MTPKRIIIDTDLGIDDACAILLALASPELSIEGLSIVHGNCSLEQATTNALAILELANAGHIAVAKGCELPLVQPPLLAPETHGDKGLGYAQLPEPRGKAHSPAWKRFSHRENHGLARRNHIGGDRSADKRRFGNP